MGRNLGLRLSSKRINNVLFGIQQRRYYLIGADSGVGKTTFANFFFVLEAYLEAKRTGRPLHIRYYSFEISEEELIAKWISYVISITNDGLSLSMDYILGRIEGLKVSDEHMDLIDQAMVFLDELLECMTIYDTPKNPTAIFHDMIDYAETVGTVHRKEVVDRKRKDKKGNALKTTYITGFTLDDPNALVLIVLDHIALCTPEQGLDTKKTMDLMSKYFIFIRNKFTFSPVVIQQFNTELQSVERRKFRAAALAPQRTDFGDSKYTYRDADVVFGLLNPSFFDIAEFYGYSVLPSKANSHSYHLGEFFIMAFLMKNRYGQSNVQIPLFMNGMTGIFYDLPDPEDGFALEEYAEMGENIRQLNRDYSPQIKTA